MVYAYNATRFDQTVSSTDASGADFDKISNELSVGEETLGTASSHELFLTAYRDWPNASRWTPWAGAGVGNSLGAKGLLLGLGAQRESGRHHDRRRPAQCG